MLFSGLLSVVLLVACGWGMSPLTAAFFLGRSSFSEYLLRFFSVLGVAMMSAAISSLSSVTVDDVRLIFRGSQAIGLHVQISISM